MNMPQKLGRLLAVEGHQYRYVGDVGLVRDQDGIVVKKAREEREVIVTHGLDYGRLLAFSGEASPSVMIFRLRNTQPLLRQIMSHWVEMENPPAEGAIVVIEDAALRIRRLPPVLEERS